MRMQAEKTREQMEQTLHEYQQNLETYRVNLVGNTIVNKCHNYLCFKGFLINFIYLYIYLFIYLFIYGSVKSQIFGDCIRGASPHLESYIYVLER